MEMQEVDAEYETRMAGFEADCNSGKGEAMACHQVGEFFSVVKNDHARAAKVYADNCNRGFAPSCFNLGRLYLGGRGVEQDDVKAEQLFDKACQSGHLVACYHNALMQFLQATGKGKDKSFDKTRELAAVEKMKKNCEAGDLDSCYFAGGYLINPKLPGESRDPARSLQYFSKACEENHAPSCYNLAVLYKKGDVGISPDPELHDRYKDKTNELIKIGGIAAKKVG